MSRQPPGPPPPPIVQRLRIRYAKRGRLRFTSHRDVARMLERALRRAQIPMAFSAGFSPHPKLSYAGAAPTGVASEAEYLEIALAERRDPADVLAALDGALPPGIDILEVIEGVPGEGPSLAERIEASYWQIRLPGVAPDAAEQAAEHLLGMTEAPVQRATKDGFRTVDARSAIVSLRVGNGAPDGDVVPEIGACATLDLAVRHATPAVRPDDVLTALRTAAGLTTPVAPVVTRLAQGLLNDTSPGDADLLSDPLG
ncbi:MAG TPA: TIGR03936 family radical SAM-associated protein [Mycobacteriales bacterium]|nr:TIGR03936 family radical SAM-associated protein [Mycobacteriales bacterium]